LVGAGVEEADREESVVETSKSLVDSSDSGCVIGERLVEQEKGISTLAIEIISTEIARSYIMEKTYLVVDSSIK